MAKDARNLVLMEGGHVTKTFSSTDFADLSRQRRSRKRYYELSQDRNLWILDLGDLGDLGVKLIDEAHLI